MTRTEVVMVDPADVVAIVLECTECQTRVRIPLNRWQSGTRQCPGCGRASLGRSAGSQALDELAKALDILSTGLVDQHLLARLEINE